MGGLFSSVGGMLSVLEWQGFLAALIFAAVHTAILIRLLPRGSLISLKLLIPGLLLGAAAFPPSIALVQVPLQAAASRWAMASLATADPLITQLPAILLSGGVQETIKAIVALAVLLLVPAGVSATSRFGGLAAGYWTGLGYGTIEAWIILSAAVSAGYGWSDLAGGSLERFLVIPIHAGLTALAIHVGWRRGFGSGILAVVGVALYHALLNYGVVWVSVGLISMELMMIWIFLLVGAVMWGVVRVARR